MDRESIAIVGPGRMGVGIATAVLMADSGHKVTLIDTKTRETGMENDALDRAHAEVEANLSLLDELGMLRGNVPALAGNLGVTGMMAEGIAGCSYVFEALPEVVAIKQAFYKKINWNIEPISMEKEIRNTRIMGIFLIAFTLFSVVFPLIIKFF